MTPAASSSQSTAGRGERISLQRMSPRLALRAALLCVSSIPFAQAQVQTDRPNIMIVMTDDQGWGDIRSHGNPLIDTPVMDRLAREGVRFDRFFVSSVCAPTRAALLTGRHHLRTGTQWVTRGLETMRPEEVTVAEIFRAEGYATGLFGKWHNGAHYPADARGQGFHTFFGFAAGHWNNYFDTTLEYNGSAVQTEGFITDVLTDSALAFIDRHHLTPFLVYIPFNAPHSPFQVPDAYYDRYKSRGLDDRTAAIYGMVENVDDNLGRLLAKLEETGIADRTIVIFLTDNGPNGDRYNGQMRGVKASVDEGGVRVPLFIRWPGRLPAGHVIREIADHIDLLPTIADLAGIQLPANLSLDGVSLAPLMNGAAPHWPDRLLFSHHSRGIALESYPGAVRSSRYRAVRTGERWELYDMISDSAQRVDVALELPAVVESLSTAYESWFADVSKGLTGPPPIPVGYEVAPEVLLPATESDLSGSIRFAGGAGWANDWLTNWTSTEDRVCWSIDVADPGRFRTALRYSVSSHDAGATVRIAVGGQIVSRVISKVHDEPPVPSPDRVPRGEVYEKTWAQVEIGTLELGEGPTHICVDATTIPGRRVADLKGITLTRMAQ